MKVKRAVSGAGPLFTQERAAEVDPRGGQHYVENGIIWAERNELRPVLYRTENHVQ